MSLAPAPDVPPQLHTFLAFDFGLKRTGVAVGNRLLRSATPQATIQAQGDGRFAAVEVRMREWQPDALVVGVPFHPDGASHDNTLRAQHFARQSARPLQLAGVRSRRALQHHRGAGRRARRTPTPARPASFLNNS